MARDLGKQAGALEQAATTIQSYADQLDAQKRQAVSQVQSTPWQGVAATTAAQVATDIELSLARHIANMRTVAEKVRSAAAQHDAADEQAGQLLGKVAGQLRL